MDDIRMQLSSTNIKTLEQLINASCTAYLIVTHAFFSTEATDILTTYVLRHRGIVLYRFKFSRNAAPFERIQFAIVKELKNNIY